jgi:TerC family integral membrane protein
MRSYPRNSPEAAARIVALIMVADGHVSRSETAALDRLHASTLLDIAPADMARVLRELSEDLMCTAYAPWGRRLLAFDLGVLHKDDHEIGVRESLLLSAGYISVALLFGAWVWWYLGAQSGMDYYTGFMIEKSLSMDNVFVIALIFSFFAIPRQYQHRVLFWGILGVIVLRAIMIGLGATLVSQFSWVLYLFGAFLIFTGIKMWDCRPHARHREQPAAEVPEAAHARDRRPARQRLLGARARHQDGQAGTLRDALFLALCWWSSST